MGGSKLAMVGVLTSQNWANAANGDSLCLPACVLGNVDPSLTAAGLLGKMLGVGCLAQGSHVGTPAQHTAGASYVCLPSPLTSLVYGKNSRFLHSKQQLPFSRGLSALFSKDTVPGNTAVSFPLGLHRGADAPGGGFGSLRHLDLNLGSAPLPGV